MAIEQKAVQTHYRRTLNQLSAGMIANNMPTKCETGRLITTGTYPDTLPFGYAVGWVDGDTDTYYNEKDVSQNWDAGHKITRGVARSPIGTLGVALDNSETGVNIKYKSSSDNDQTAPGRGVLVGDVLVVGNEAMLITAIATNGDITVNRGWRGTTAKAHTSTTEHVYKLNGPTNFAGIAIANVALPGNNDPVDTYNSNDLVTVGSEGDFVVVCKEEIKRGNPASVYVGTDKATYGTFGNSSEIVGMSATSAGDYISIPGAIFMTSSQSVTPYSGGDAKILAVLRVSMQPR